jgi:gas vesicle protein
MPWMMLWVGILIGAVVGTAATVVIIAWTDD